MREVSDQQLKRIHAESQGRTSRGEVAVVGDLAKAALNSGRLAGPAWRRRLVATIEEHTGGELLQQASVVGVREGVLRLQVHEPAQIYGLKLQWEQRLLTLLARELPDSGINAIWFMSAERP